MILAFLHNKFDFFQSNLLLQNLIKFIYFDFDKKIISSSIKLVSGECIGINVDNGELMDASEAQIYDHILIKDWQARLGKNY